MKWIKRLLFLIIALLFILFIVFLLIRKPSTPIAELKAKYTNAESEFIEIDGTQVHYRREGSGDPILLIHGTASSLHTWDAWTEVLDDSHEVIRLDTPGFGLTGSVENSDYQIPFYVDYIDKFLTKLGIDSFAICGNSLGGEIAWNYASKYPDKVSKMILIDAAGFPSDEVPAIFKMATNPLLAPIIKQLTPRSLIEKNIKEVYADDSKVTTQLVDRYYDLQLREGNRDAFVIRAKSYVHQAPEKKLASLNTPTLIQWGSEDLWIPVDQAHKFDQHLPNSTLKVYNSGHVPMEENPMETVKDALTFLEN